MKKIIVIDTITEDRSIDQLGHLCSILSLENKTLSLAHHPEKQYQLRSFHLATENLDINELSGADAVIFSGSVKSVYEEFAWKKQMHQALDVAILKQIPTLAVCFGAQFLAHHLGGKVSKNPRGVEFGPIKIQLTKAGQEHSLLKDYHQDRFLFATHQDYIEATPPGTTLLAWNDNTPVQAFQFGPVLATQFHVDIPTARARQLLESRKQKYLDQGFLKDEQHFLDLLDSLPQAESAYDILKRFIHDPQQAILKAAIE